MRQGMSSILNIIKIYHSQCEILRIENIAQNYSIFGTLGAADVAADILKINSTLKTHPTIP